MTTGRINQIAFDLGESGVLHTLARHAQKDGSPQAGLREATPQGHSLYTSQELVQFFHHQALAVLTAAPRQMSDTEERHWGDSQALLTSRQAS